MRERRRELLAGARGRTVELGAGTGLNFAHYPDAVGELILTEPFEPMAKRLRERAGGRTPTRDRGAGRPAAAPRCLGRHRRLHARPLHRRRRPGDARRDRARPPARRAAVVRRARPLRRPEARPLAGPARGPVEVRRARLPLQSRHGRGDRRLAARGRDGRARTTPEGGADRPAPDRRQRPPAPPERRAPGRVGLQRNGGRERNGARHRPTATRGGRPWPISSC